MALLALMSLVAIEALVALEALMALESLVALMCGPHGYGCPLGPGFKLFSAVFIGPRCPWGPIYGSGPMSVTPRGFSDLTYKTLAD